MIIEKRIEPIELVTDDDENYKIIQQIAVGIDRKFYVRLIYIDRTSGRKEEEFWYDWEPVSIGVIKANTPDLYREAAMLFGWRGVNKKKGGS